MAVALGVSEVSKHYGPTHALNQVSLAVERGTVHALLGGNGSGKSTLVKILAGVVRADSGQVAIGSRTLSADSITPSLASAAQCFFVHQDPGVFPDLNVADNLHLGHGFQTTGLKRIKWRGVRARTREILEQYEIDADPTTLVRDLGPATQTKLAIARALQGRDTSADGVLVLDEPTASLPAHEVGQLLAALRRYADAGQGIVFVTHRLTEVCEVADEATILRNGEVVGALDRQEITPERLTDLIAGAAAPEESVEQTTVREDRPAILVVEGLSGGKVEDCTFELRAGEILGLAGLIGSGRSTLLQLLFGLRERRAGEIVLTGTAAAPRTPSEAMAAGIAYVPADRKREGLFPDLTVSENLAMAVVPKYWRRGRLRADGRSTLTVAIIGRQDPDREGLHLVAVGRQPAEGDARPMAPPAAKGPAPRRAHPGCRHRGTARNPRHAP